MALVENHSLKALLLRQEALAVATARPLGVGGGVAGRGGELWGGWGQVLPDSRLHLPAALARPPVGTLLPGSREGRRRARPRALESSARREPRTGTHPGPGGFLSPATPGASHFPRPTLGPGWGQKLWKLLPLSVGWHLEETGPPGVCRRRGSLEENAVGNASERQEPSFSQVAPACSGWVGACGWWGHTSNTFWPGSQWPSSWAQGYLQSRSHLSVSDSGWAAVRGSRDPYLGPRGQTAAETRSLRLGPALAGAFAPRPVGGRRSRPTCLETQCPRRRNRAWPAPFQFP